MLKTKRRRLFLDIETSPNVGLFWQAGYKQKIDPSNIIKERAIICVCYKWEDEKEVYGLTWDSKQNDKKLLINLIEVCNQANEIVAHNGDKFDMPWIRGRCLFHRVPVPPNYQTIDTLKIARSSFRLNSNKLNYIANFLGLGSKIKTEFGLWKDIVLSNSKPAMDRMVKYCKKDVTLLEKVFNELKMHVEPKTHYGVIFGGDRGNCPECGSDDLRVVRRKTTATGLKKIQYQCKTCNRHHSKTDK